MKPVIGIVELQRGSWYYMEVKGAEMFPSVVNGECQLQKISASQKQQIIEPFRASRLKWLQFETQLGSLCLCAKLARGCWWFIWEEPDDGPCICQL